MFSTSALAEWTAIRGAHRIRKLTLKRINGDTSFQKQSPGALENPHNLLLTLFIQTISQGVKIPFASTEISAADVSKPGQILSV